MSKSAFTRTKFTLTVLSEEPIPDGTDISNILRECDTGEFVLASVDTMSETLTPKTMAQALIDAGSEPEFFRLELSESRYEAQFVPQAWVNDYAITVDAQGETHWDATEFVSAADPEWLERTMEHGHDPEHGADHDDILRNDPNAPEWVREFQGPFETFLRIVT